MQRRRPLLPFDPAQDLDVEAQQYAPPAMPMAQPPPPMQFAPMQPDTNLAPLAQMGTQRALEYLLNRKKKPASPADALTAFKTGGSL